MNTSDWLSSPSTDLIVEPAKVCASRRGQFRSTNIGLCANAAGKCRIFIHRLAAIFRRRRLEHSSDSEAVVHAAVRRAKQGDEEAMRFLYLRYADNVYGYVLANWHALAPCMDNWLNLGNEAQVIAYASLGAGAIVTVFPVVWMISTSLKATGTEFTFPPQIIPSPIAWSNSAVKSRALDGDARLADACIARTRRPTGSPTGSPSARTW